MLTRIHIENFRLCRNVTIENAGAIVALVGRNGAGKSNVFQAIDQTARMATMAEVPGAQVFHPGKQPGSVSLEFSPNEESDPYRYDRGVQIRRAAGGGLTPIITERLSAWENGAWVTILDRNAGMVAIAENDRHLPIGDFTPSLPAISTLLPSTD